MSAARHDIVIEDNSQFDFYITKEDSECVATDITGYGAKWQVRAAKASTSTVLFETTVGSGIIIQPSGETGKIRIQLTVAQVNAPGVATWGRGWHDLLIWPPTGSITDGAKKLVKGKVDRDLAVTFP